MTNGRLEATASPAPPVIYPPQNPGPSLCWATDYEGLGNAYGFTLGNRLGRQAAIDAGCRIDPDADIAVHHCPPHSFQPLPNKVNVLWTAWEFPEVIPAEVEGLKKADVLFATARFLVPLFERKTGAPTYYVRQGIRSDLFPIADLPSRSSSLRPPASRRFRYLWVGAPNDRKGWRHVLAAWKAFARDDSCELFLKTTFAGDGMRSGRFGNVIVETTPYTDEQMAGLYARSHCFLLPSMGEGFGFTLGEAMATGLPCIFTPATALADLCDERCGFPVRFQWQKCFEMEMPPGSKHLLKAANVEVPSLVRRMEEVRRNYDRALRKGREAADLVRERFTWEQAGRELRSRLETVACELDVVKSNR